ncbi:MAG TPA: sigma-70 family RNA polymerase sigma factor [Tepidisphaeraceae bacterium]|nr:sigma-70 family RNA polymerase sigma factor [Tepidisphaeraceae bacterium]
MATVAVSKMTKTKQSQPLPGTIDRARERALLRMNPPHVPSKAGERIPRALRQKVEALLAESYDFMDSPTFKQKNIEKQLFDFEGGVEPALPMTAWYQPTRDEVLDEAIVGAPQLMKAAEERLMFQRFNFSKRKLSQLQKLIKRDGLTRERAELFLDWHRRFEHFREYLVRTNLALVLAMAKRTRLGDVDFAEVVSEGNMALIRAVDKFNVDKGFKFSTYACRAILKAFSRTALKASKHRTRFPVEFEPDMEKSDWSDRKRDAVEEDCIDELKAIVQRNLADLSPVEDTVIRRRFNWEQQEETPLTLEEVGQIIGVTKERVRQIQNKALAKIRQVLEEGVLRTKPRLPGEALKTDFPSDEAPTTRESAD